jgi:hypothetical protein
LVVVSGRTNAAAGCDLTAPLAHVDVTESSGVKHTLLVEEIREWLNDPKQTAFVHREGLAVLLQRQTSVTTADREE